MGVDPRGQVDNLSCLWFKSDNSWIRVFFWSQWFSKEDNATLLGISGICVGFKASNRVCLNVFDIKSGDNL